MNNAPLARQFQPHVGSKTTISLMNQHHGKLIAGRVPLKHKNAIVTLHESAHPHVRNEIYPNIRSRFRFEGLSLLSLSDQESPVARSQTP